MGEIGILEKTRQNRDNHHFSVFLGPEKGVVFI